MRVSVNLGLGFILKSRSRATLILTVFSTLNKTNDLVKDNYINSIYIFLASFQHFTPVFNPIVCILTNKPYKEAVFNRLQIHPQ